MPVVLAMLAWPTIAQDVPEAEIKAAFLIKFIPFITWPENVFTAPGQPVTLCVLGEDGLGGRLEALAGERSGDRPVAIRHLKAAAEESGCQLLFLVPGPDEPEALAAAAGRPIVTVTDTGLTPPGIISFVSENNHLRFDIDDAEARRDGIEISSKLLELAHNVRRKAPS